MGQKFSSDDTEFIRRFPAAAITHGFSRRRPVRSIQYPLDCKKSHRFHRYTQIFHRSFLVTQISQMTQIFSSGIFIHRMTRNLFGGFLLRRLLTDFHGCDLFGRYSTPEVVKSPTDFTDIHRFFHRSFLVPQISQIFTDFFLHRMTQN